MSALNVVHDRLKELGLQRFCLEAHSTKAGKQKIIDELRRTLEAETSDDGDALERELQALLRVRDELNAYARELHAPIHPLGSSVYRANSRLAHLSTVSDVRSPLPFPNPLDASRDDLETCLRALEELGSNASVFDLRADHPWRGFAPAHFGLSEQESLEAAFREVTELSRRISNAARKLEALIPEARDLSFADWRLLRSVLAAVAETERLPHDWWSQSEETLAFLSQLFTKASELQRELETIHAVVAESSDRVHIDLVPLLSLVVDKYAGWYSAIQPSYWQWRRKVRAVLRPAVRFSRERVASLHSSCCRAEDIGRWFDEHRATIDVYLGPNASPNPIALTTVASSFAVAGLCRKGLAAVGKNAVSTIPLSPELRTACRELVSFIPEAEAPAPTAVKQLDTDWPNGFVDGVVASRSPLPKVANRAADLLASTPRAREWVLLIRAIQGCTACGLAPFLDGLGEVSAIDAPRIFERRFLRLWLSSALDRAPALAAFTETKGRDLIEKFRILDERVRRLAIARAQMVASSASARVRAAQDVPESASEISTLRYELQKKKRIKPLRKLFAEIPRVLQALKPCMLMSPISVSTYLKPGVFKFDLVVFDEASQLPTAEAVPAILRATQVVVAGDPNQLPPTSFFEASLVTEDEEEDEGTLGQTPLESLLNDCVAVVPVFQEANLRWHYRSRDERLIKFSNHYFYDNKLVTFPAANPAADGQGVRFVHVADGVYDRGRSRMNRPEAGTVARLALEHFVLFPDRTLGIVAMNLSQKDAIEDAIAEALGSRPDLAAFFDETRHEAVFVKSLENVQGDERDTMIISVGYGRDHQGGLSMNFGPINTDGGWRRLNVLVTRAKWECVLVSSLRASQLADINPNSRGAISLRNFLEFVERHVDLPAEAAVQTHAETNDFEDAVRAALVERGLVVEAQVGASRYRIDLAIRDRHDPRRYALGIECDGATYHNSRTARDRDLLRQQVLQRMGWRIHRVWSTEWFQNREQAIEGIIRSLQQAEANSPEHTVWAPQMDATSETAVNPAPPNPPRAASRQYKPGVPYSLYRSSRNLSREYLLENSYIGLLADTIGGMVRAEGPIHHDVLLERLKDLHNVQKAGSNIRSNVDQALRYALRSRTVAHDSPSPFYFVPDYEAEGFRTATEFMKRPIEHIAPSEIAQAMLFLIEDQFSIFEEAAPTAVARLFGIERLHGESANVIRKVVEDLVSKGRLRRNGAQVHLP
jgi:very-short-patch-repair endonuclease